MNPYQAALGIFWSVCVLSLAQLNKSLLEEGTLQLSGKGLADGNINKTLSGPLDPGIAVPLAQSSAPTSRAGGTDPAQALCCCQQGRRLHPAPVIEVQLWAEARLGQMLPCPCHAAVDPGLSC